MNQHRKRPHVIREFFAGVAEGLNLGLRVNDRNSDWSPGQRSGPSSQRDFSTLFVETLGRVCLPV
jgi:hypothetical protein